MTLDEAPAAQTFEGRRPFLPRRVRAALVDFARRLDGAFGPRVQEVKLFGSYARGDFGTDSDVDVLVVADTLAHGEKRAVFDLAEDVFFKTLVTSTATSTSPKAPAEAAIAMTTACGAEGSWGRASNKASPACKTSSMRKRRWPANRRLRARRETTLPMSGSWRAPISRFPQAPSDPALGPRIFHRARPIALVRTPSLRDLRSSGCGRGPWRTP